jgi:glycosyltransferase involved in cell wall biosynthesis
VKIAPIPSVSVIVPMYNTRDYVGATLDSVLAQTFPDFEVIVVDDGSTDGCTEIVAEYVARDPRITCIRQNNAGLAAARNVGIAAARGTAIAFLDSDDLWLPEKLARQLPLVTGNTVVHADAYVFIDGEPVGETRLSDVADSPDGAETFESLLEQNRIGVLTAVVPRDLLLAHGCFDSALRSCEDYDLWLRLAAAGITFRALVEPLAAYRRRKGALSADPVWMAEHRTAVYEKLATTTQGTRQKAAAKRASRERRLLTGELRARGWLSIRNGSVGDGRRDLRRSIRVAPTWWRSWLLAVMITIPFSLRPLAARATRRQTETPAS